MLQILKRPKCGDNSKDIAELKAALNCAGYDASESDIEWAWERVSDEWSAQWLSVGAGDSEVSSLLGYLVVEEVEQGD